MTRRRSNLTKVEAWTNEKPTDLSNVWIASSPVVESPIYSDRPWSAVATIAALWGQNTSTGASPQSVKQCERYTYSVGWDEAAEVFVATVAEFPGLVRRSQFQMLAFCDLLTDVREHVRDLETGRAVKDERGMRIPGRVKAGSKPIPGPGGKPLPAPASEPAPSPGGNIIDLEARRSRDRH